MELPKIGMGTFGSDKYDEKTVANAVKFAIKAGYRLFDCASVYGNESEIGDVFTEAFESGVTKREDIVVISKVWNDMHGEGKVIESCFNTLKDLKLDYLDIYFMHWPFPNYHAKGCDVDSRNPDSRPFYVDEFMTAWRQMEWLKKNGFVKEIAMSNMTVPKLEAVLPLCEIKPYAHEMELHPSFQQKALYEYCITHSIKIIGYCPLGSPNRPERDRTPDDVADTEMSEIVSIANEHGCHPAEICLAWAMQLGHTPIPFASREINIIKNLTVQNKIVLSRDEMETISNLDCDNRLVKGHVFLWNGATDWHDLWDEGKKLVKWIKLGERFVKVID